jgi:hypothetical protein
MGKEFFRLKAIAVKGFPLIKSPGNSTKLFVILPYCHYNVMFTLTQYGCPSDKEPSCSLPSN